MIEFWTSRMEGRAADTRFGLERADLVSWVVYNKLFIALTLEEQLMVAILVHCGFDDTKLLRGDRFNSPITDVVRVDPFVIRGVTTGTAIIMKCPHFEGPW